MGSRRSAKVVSATPGAITRTCGRRSFDLPAAAGVINPTISVVMAMPEARAERSHRLCREGKDIDPS